MRSQAASLEQVAIDAAAAELFDTELRERLLAALAEYEAPQPQARGGAPGRCPTGTWRGKTYCLHTIVKLEVLAANTGSYLIQPLQGSYTTSTAASGNTHAGGGAGDIIHWNWVETIDNWVMNIARDVAYLIYWDRDAISGLWSDHGHFIDPSCPNLSPEARAQVIDFYNGKNGLANDGPDFGSRKSVAKLWNMYLNRSSTTVASIEALFRPKDWFDMADRNDLIAAMKDPTVLQAIAEAVASTQILHPDNERRAMGETIDWRTSAWSANTYAYMGFNDSRETLTILREFIKAEGLDDAARAAALADISERIDAIIAGSPPPEPEVPNPWSARTGPVYGFDHSSHQTLATTTSAAKSGEFAFAIIKATEGYGYDNDLYSEQMGVCRESGLMTGAYHLGWLSQDPRQEFEHFVNYAGLRLGEVGVHDVEDWGETRPGYPNYERDKAMRDATSWEQRLDHVLQWTNFHLEHFGVPDWKYMNWTYIKGLRRAAGMVNADGTIKTADEATAAWKALTRSPLWIAQFRPAGENETVSGGWRIIAHQFTNTPFDKNYMAASAPHDEWWEFGIRKGMAA